VQTLREDLRKTIRTDPVGLAGNVLRETVLMFLARLDHSVPAKTGESLRKALGQPETVFLPFGHYASVLALPFVRQKTLSFLHQRFDAVGG
jgi:hypothetical protein